MDGEWECVDLGECERVVCCMDVCDTRMDFEMIICFLLQICWTEFPALGNCD